jgi:hypothetical protein
MSIHLRMGQATMTLVFGCFPAILEGRPLRWIDASSPDNRGVSSGPVIAVQAPILDCFSQVLGGDGG